MAIETGAIFKRLYFDGQSSGTYGVYITGEAVYNAPARDVEMITIPGRNGTFALDNGRFENIEVTYPAGIFADNEADFAEAISDFRNFLASRTGYCRLEDDYNPTEYRMAVYKSGLDVDAKVLKAGEFDITFDCKPQRWLKDGETAVTIGEWGETETASGDIVSVENPNGILAVKSLEVDLEPIQDLHGYDKPWSGGNGANLIDDTYNGLPYTNEITLTEGTYYAQAFLVGAKSEANSRLQIYLNDSWTLIDSTSFSADDGAFTANGSTFGWIYSNALNTISVTSGSYRVRFSLDANLSTTRRLSISKTQQSSWTPYSNICPISGRTECDVYVSPTTSETDAEVYTTALGRTVYGGTLDVVSGVLTVDMMYDQMTYAYLSGLTTSIGFTSSATQVGGNAVWVRNWHYDIAEPRKEGGIEAYCNAFPIAMHDTNMFASQNRIYLGIGSMTSVAEFLQAVQTLEQNGSGLFIAFKLATPQTYQLTAQQISLLTGDNNIWSDSGAITLEYGQNPSVLFNPTLFESGPLLDVYGYGSISFNDYTIEITPQFYGEVDILGSKSGFTYSLRTDLYNSGDTIYLTAKKRLGVKITDPRKTFDDYDEWTMTDSGSGTTAYTARTPSYIEMETNFVDVAIDSSQSSQTITNTFSGTVSINHVAYSLSAVFTATYSKGNGTITLDAGSTAGAGFPNNKRTNTMGWVSIIANSTKSMLGDPTYIDCDIGEAYLLSDGMPVSLNQYIDLGSELPTLGVGANEVTFDNTITELKVTPRFWKV